LNRHLQKSFVVASVETDKLKIRRVSKRVLFYYTQSLRKLQRLDAEFKAIFSNFFDFFSRKTARRRTRRGAALISASRRKFAARRLSTLLSATFRVLRPRLLFVEMIRKSGADVKTIFSPRPRAVPFFSIFRASTATKSTPPVDSSPTPQNASFRRPTQTA